MKEKEKRFASRVEEGWDAWSRRNSFRITVSIINRGRLSVRSWRCRRYFLSSHQRKHVFRLTIRRIKASFRKFRKGDEASAWRRTFKRCNIGNVAFHRPSLFLSPPPPKPLSQSLTSVARAFQNFNSRISFSRKNYFSVVNESEKMFDLNAGFLFRHSIRCTDIEIFSELQN